MRLTLIANLEASLVKSEIIGEYVAGDFNKPGLLVLTQIGVVKLTNPYNEWLILILGIREHIA